MPWVTGHYRRPRGYGKSSSGAGILAALVIGAIAKLCPATPKSTSVAPSAMVSSAAPSKVNSGSNVRLVRDCDAWGFDGDGKAVRLTRISKGETLNAVASDESSVAVTLEDGRRAWVNR